MEANLVHHFSRHKYSGSIQRKITALRGVWLFPQPSPFVILYMGRSTSLRAPSSQMDGSEEGKDLNERRGTEIRGHEAIGTGSL